MKLLRIGILGVFICGILGCQTDRHINISVPAIGQGQYFSLWEPYFTEPIEKVYFYFHDQSIYGFTSNLETKINGPVDEWFETIRGLGKSIQDIDIIIHNHLSDFVFSPGDKTVYFNLLDRGFRGRFLLYQPTGQIDELRLQK